MYLVSRLQNTGVNYKHTKESTVGFCKLATSHSMSTAQQLECRRILRSFLAAASKRQPARWSRDSPMQSNSYYPEQQQQQQQMVSHSSTSRAPLPQPQHHHSHHFEISAPLPTERMEDSRSQFHGALSGSGWSQFGLRICGCIGCWGWGWGRALSQQQSTWGA